MKEFITLFKEASKQEKRQVIKHALFAIFLFGVFYALLWLAAIMEGRV